MRLVGVSPVETHTAANVARYHGDAALRDKSQVRSLLGLPSYADTPLFQCVQRQIHQVRKPVPYFSLDLSVRRLFLQIPRRNSSGSDELGAYE